MGAPVSFVQTGFTGGEWSKSAQGRIDDPAYRKALNVCHNGLPIEAGAWQRRPGFWHRGWTRGGQAAKVITFDFQQATPHTIELSDQKLRFWADGELVTTNDPATITAISSATPAVVTTSPAHGWLSGTILLNTNVTQLQNRPLSITVLTATTFSIADAIGGASVDGSTLDAFTSGTARMVLELLTPYQGDLWRNVRSVQAETTAVLLNGMQPQILTVESLPEADQNATFAVAASNFLDGPYLDPFPGSIITPSDVSGVITLTLSFQAYSAAVAYDIGAYVTSVGQGYKSLTAANQGHTPAASPSHWVAVNAGDPINDGAGFTSADIGRLIRLFSEPALWAAGSSYSAGDVVAYPTGTGASGYWKATASISAGVQPGTSTSWAILTPGAIWTWARMLTVSAAGVVGAGTPVGTLTGGGGLAALFDGTTTKGFATAANTSSSTATYPAWVQPTSASYSVGAMVQYNGTIYEKLYQNLPGALINEVYPPAGNPLWNATGTVSSITLDHYGGNLYSPAQQIASVTLYPTTDVGFTNSPSGGVVLNLRAKATAPASASDGTLLGSVSIANTTSPVSLVSSDQSTAFNYIWIEAVATFNQPLPDDGSHVFTAKLAIAQMVVYAPNIANGSVITAQIVGDALLYNLPIRKWRLGAYGGVNGWPTCGTYHGSRLWLSGVIGNRVDASKSGILKNGALTLDFAPTAPSGAVADDNAITAVCTAKDVSTIFWMEPKDDLIVCGTQGGEAVIAPAAQGAMSPTNTSFHRRTDVGCANIEPATTDHTIVFVQTRQRKVMEYFADVSSGRLSAPNLSRNVKHLSVGGIAQLAYQQELVPVIWVRTEDGRLFGLTYKRDKLTTESQPDILGGHRHTLGSGRTIASMCVSDDSLTLVTVDGDGVHHIEMMATLLDEGFVFTDVMFLDDAIRPTAFALSTAAVDGAPYGGVTLYGLRAHEGAAVTPYLVGLDCGMTTGALDALVAQTFTVEDGAIFVPFGDGVSAGTAGGLFTAATVQPYLGQTDDLPMAVGFPFTSQGQLVRPQMPVDTGTQAGPGFGKKRRIPQYTMQLYGVVNGSLYVGTDFTTRTLKPVILRKVDDKLYTRLEYFSGIHRDTLMNDSDYDSMIAWQIVRPHPAFVMAVGGNNIQTQDA